MMRKFNDLMGQRFGKLVVIERAGKDKHRNATWLCQCDCGNTVVAKGYNLTKSNGTKSCGQCKSPRDLTGMRFGRLIVIRRAGLDKTGNNSMWLCKCDCGNEKIVSRVSLCGTRCISCGCYSSERSRELIKSLHERHRDKYPKIPRLFTIWRKIRSRCFDPNNDSYGDYGGRGISICKEWGNFYEFQEWAVNSGYSRELTIDRIDVDGDYCPENCRWVTAKQQARNKRKTIYLTLHGECKSMAEWADALGISWRTLNGRRQRGWSDERILTEPIHKKLTPEAEQ